MASIFGEHCVDDLLNDNLREEHELPSDDEQKRDDNAENLFDEFGLGDEAENGAETEQKGIKVEPKKRSVRNPRLRLTIDILSGPRGIQAIEDYFKDIKFQGKGHEKHDLNEIMRRLQHWAHRMYPTYKFDDVLTNIERLGKKKALQVHMSRYRLGMLDHLKLNTEHQMPDEDDEGAGMADNVDEPFDEFDALLGEQIAISKLAPHTPATSRHSRDFDALKTNSTVATPSFSRGKAVMSTPLTGKVYNALDDSELAHPLPPSQPSTPSQAPATKQLTSEQLALIAENRRKAQERLKVRQQQQRNQLETVAT